MTSAPHASAALEVCRRLGVDPERGLRGSEAEGRLLRDGPNALPEASRPSSMRLLARQLASPLVALLAGASVVSLAAGDSLDAALIVVIVVLNTALGYVQESRAEEAAAGLRSVLAPTARVVRDGAISEVDARGLVAGDVVLLRAGERVPADGRLVETTTAEVDESGLTGESLPVAKRVEPPVDPRTPVAERETMAFAGTAIARGSARLVVTATGEGTEMGRTAAEAARAERPRTPLQRRIDRFASVLLRAAIALCIAIAALAWARGTGVVDSILVGVSLAVAAVPEGLPAVLTIALAIGMQRMARRGAIVRRLQAVETLGSATVICADKTGTLTEGRMRLARVFAAGAEIDLTASESAQEEAIDRLLGGALLASRTEPGPVDAIPESVGNATESAIFAAARERDVRADGLAPNATAVAVEPFDSTRKRMSVVVESAEGARASYVKGAPEALLPELECDGRERDTIESTARSWAQAGTRVLLVARGQGAPGAAEPPGLAPLGLLGFEDPPRPDARRSVARARRAGVRTVMITGDHPGTAAAVARATGISDEADTSRLITGPELDRLTDAELGDVADRVTIYARVVPQHKLRIVNALREGGEVVAMTGDGVNDAPALRVADIGVAMGRRGTDAAREAADLVLSDDDYSTIVRAIRRGRTIYDNVLRFISFLLAANAGEVLLFCLAIALGFSAPVTVVQILVVNLLTDGLPAVALGVDPPARGLMRRRPRPLDEGILDPIRGLLLAGGLATGLAAFAAFLIGHDSSHALGRTMAFTTLVFSQLAFVFAVRGRGWVPRAGRNTALYLAVLLSAAAMAAVLAVPALAGAFDVVSMSAPQLTVALGLAAIPFLCAGAVTAARRPGVGR